MIKKATQEEKKIIIAYILYAVIWFIFHMQCTRYGDDAAWVNKNSVSEYINYYTNHVSVWSSRFIIDFIGIIVLSIPMIVWRILDSLVMVLMTVQLNKLFDEKKNIKVTLLIMSVCFIYPFTDMGTAGWIATTYTYLWSTAFFFYAVRIWRDAYRGKKIYVWQYVLSVLAYAYAIDQQQVAGVAVMLCFIMLWVLRKEIKPSHIILTVLTVVRFLLHLFWPGGSRRTSSETSSWFPDFGTLSLFDKLQIGTATAFKKVFLDGDIIFLLAGIFLAVLVFRKYKDALHRLIVLLPNVILFLWGPLRYLISIYFVGVNSVLSESAYSLNESYSDLYGMINPNNYYSERAYLIFFLCGLAVICMIVSIIAVYGMNNSGFLYSAILIVGFISRIILGFSPTVYASGTRTYIYLYFAGIVLIIAFAKRMITEQGKCINILMDTVYICGVLSAWNLYLVIPTIG